MSDIINDDNTNNDNISNDKQDKSPKKALAFVEWIKDVVDLIKDNKRILISVIVFVVLLVSAILISSRFAKRSREATAVLEEETAAVTETYTIPEEPLKQDAYPEVNNLMKKYYTAVAQGDITSIETLRTGLDDKEKIVIEKKAQYVENYPNITCYTKPGPLDKSYLVYVSYEVKLNDFEDLIPGMNVWYVCSDDTGKYYINEDPQDDKIIDYCKIVSVQDDVQDLSNTINVKYNEIMENNTELAKFMDELGTQMKVDVGEELAKAEAPVEEPTPTPTPTPEPESEAEPEVKTVRATTVVNVRASDSEKADKVGKASEGQEFTLLEEKANGWSKIDFEGKEAFIKSEYLEAVGTTQTASADTEEKKEEKTEDKSTTSTDNKSTTDSKNTSDADKPKNEEASKNSPSSGSGTATDTIKVREKPTTDSAQLGTVYGGQKLEIVEKQSDGWTKVKYKDKTGYVKSEYLR